MPPGHPIILLKCNKFNMAVSVKRLIKTSKNNVSEIYTSPANALDLFSVSLFSLEALRHYNLKKSLLFEENMINKTVFFYYPTALVGLLLKTPRGSLKSEASLF